MDLALKQQQRKEELVSHNYGLVYFKIKVTRINESTIMLFSLFLEAIQSSNLRDK